MTKKKPAPEHKDTEDLRPAFHSSMPGFCAATWNITAGNRAPPFPYSCELPLCYFASKGVCSPEEHVNRASSSYKDGRDHNETVDHCSHSDSPHKIQMDSSKNALSCSGTQKAITPSGAVDRFMPRTTQLQERKRRREDDHKLGHFETSTSSNEVLIGPKLPDIPKVDLQDDSLNTTANLIRNKLKEVISSVPKPPEDKSEAVYTSHPLKQRRRI